ncbi:MAG: ABC transporter ATP-binding protein [Planctomycetaceae bacterium]|jgi:iron complex transport system ATP-binding protein|nr:ABC transporter ATP-binding protein [Planctomycetaceae bacterium]
MPNSVVNTDKTNHIPILSPLLSVRNLTVKRKTKTLLNAVSFDVVRGEHLTIIGANGAGKSTLLKCLDNLLNLWTGEILFEGQPIRKVSQRELARRIAYVQQFVPGIFAFTVRQRVEMGRYPHLRPLSSISETDQQIVEEAMRLMDIMHLADRFVETLSGGEMQKVQLAAALAQQTDVLCLDEPTTYLDYKHQREIGQWLRIFHQRQAKTIIEITHDVNRAAMESTHVIALNSGNIVFDGQPSSLMTQENLHNIYGIHFQLADHPELPIKIVVPDKGFADWAVSATTNQLGQIYCDSVRGVR